MRIFIQQLLDAFKFRRWIRQSTLNGRAERENPFSLDPSVRLVFFQSTDDDSMAPPSSITSMDMDKVKTTIKQFVRDWSQDGVQERLVCYAPIIDEVQRRFPITAPMNEKEST